MIDKTCILGLEPAHPIQTLRYNGGIQPGDLDNTYYGMSIRLQLAAMAMQSLIANPIIQRPKYGTSEYEEQRETFSKRAFEYADSLLKQEYL